MDSYTYMFLDLLGRWCPYPMAVNLDKAKMALAYLGASRIRSGGLFNEPPGEQCSKPDRVLYVTVVPLSSVPSRFSFPSVTNSSDNPN
jgi:hypothetical protein